MQLILYLHVSHVGGEALNNISSDKCNQEFSMHAYKSSAINKVLRILGSLGKAFKFEHALLDFNGQPFWG